MECARQVAEKEDEIEALQREMEITTEDHHQQIHKLNSEVRFIKLIHTATDYQRHLFHGGNRKQTKINVTHRCEVDGNAIFYGIVNFI